MTHTVVRGRPTKAQLYLDKILDEILTEQRIEPTTLQKNKLTLTQIVFHCLKKKPKSVFMTNGVTGEDLTRSELLTRAVLVARALTAHGAKGKTAICLMRNRQRSVGIYFGVLFSGVLPFMMDANCTEYEFTHFVILVEPSFVFYDEVYHNMVTKVLHSLNMSPLLVKANDTQSIEEFVQDQSGEWTDFEVTSASMEGPVLLLPTSGSTGVPKAAITTQKGLVVQLPSMWAYHTQFPTPTSKVMILTTMQWMTFTAAITSCVVYDVPILVSPNINDTWNVTEMLEKYRPSWMFMPPSYAAALVDHIRPDQWSSLEHFLLVGAPIPRDLLSALKEKLPKTAQVCDGCGTTETQGFIAITDPETPDGYCGWVMNNMHYKIVHDDGLKLGPNNTGELFLKGDCLIKGYYKNEETWRDSCTEDGWFKTGDVFYVDQNERLSYRMKKKFSFKFMERQVAPEEIETIISSIPGVHENVVCASVNGPAAVVVLQPGADVAKYQIIEAVEARLQYHKRLHGGVFFVACLPHTNTGKILRRGCSKLVDKLSKCP